MEERERGQEVGRESKKERLLNERNFEDIKTIRHKTKLTIHLERLIRRDLSKFQENISYPLCAAGYFTLSIQKVGQNQAEGGWSEIYDKCAKKRPVRHW